MQIGQHPNRLVRYNSILIYICDLSKDTFLQFSDINEGKKKQVRLKAHSVRHDKLEENHIKLTTEIAQKSRDSMLLIGADSI